jgi:hypothetical protein
MNAVTPETGTEEAVRGRTSDGSSKPEDQVGAKVEAVSGKLDSVNGKLDAVSSKLDGLSTAVEGATVAAADAGRLTGEAKAAAKTTTEAVTAKLIPQYEALEQVKEAEMHRAALAVLQQTAMPDLNREIIELYYRRNFSYDRILLELRRQQRGKSKQHVGKVIRDFNTLLKAEGLRAKETVSGSPLPPNHAFDEDEKPASVTEDNPATIAEAQDKTKEEVATTIEAWARATRKVAHNWRRSTLGSGASWSCPRTNRARNRDRTVRSRFSAVVPRIRTSSAHGRRPQNRSGNLQGISMGQVRQRCNEIN